MVLELKYILIYNLFNFLKTEVFFIYTINLFIKMLFIKQYILYKLILLNYLITYVLLFCII
ncbi:hypothetical protein HanRHA438_Chr05g0245101 [Helianthus annuus]|nr:hypothetical protein HanRHA438_Chr05g0245101 [Helianthus annuus]